MRSLDAALVARLYAESKASRWGLPVSAFNASLDTSLAHAFDARTPAVSDVERYLRSLHLEDLALAAACAAGVESAWDHFVAEHRPVLYRAADAIDPTGGARELADSLYADLFGLNERGGTRQSLFRYFHGRSRLATWLRAVLAQRHVDRVRVNRRLEPLPDEESGHAVEASPASDPARPQLLATMHRALSAAVATLVPRDRLRLGLYYAQNMKLAAIGRALGEHEATVSRHLTRTRAAIRDDVTHRLREHGMDDAAVAECFEVAVADPGTLDVAALVGVGSDRKNGGQDRSR